MDFSNLVDKLREFGALAEQDGTKYKAVPAISPKMAKSMPKGLSSVVRDAIGISSLYEHQAKAIATSIRGQHVVLESPTASGKTIAYTAPMLNELVKNPRSFAIMVYPMKALALDQQVELQKICEPLNIRVGKFDKDTPKRVKADMKKNPPQIIMTNPENLNMAFLGWREQWQFVLPRLKFLVLDEMHVYRGYFGSQMALLLRRFFLYLNRMGASTRVFLSTATCENPKPHALQLTGLDNIALIQERKALQPTRHFLFINPKLPDHNYREELCSRIEQVAVALLDEGLKALIFCPSKRFLEDASRRSKEKAKEKGLNYRGISEFHANLKASERKTRQKKIKQGDITVVFATSALELGLDIGGLDGVVLAGFPPSTMSAWQQIGRAGRHWTREAFVLFYPMQDPIDRLYVNDIDLFLKKQLDPLVINSENPEYINKHLPSLISEINGRLRQDDIQFLGKELYQAAKKKSGKPSRGRKPQSRINLRGGEGILYDLKCGDELLGQITAIEMFRYAYIGAIFAHGGEKYEVHSHEKDAVVLEKYVGNNRTNPIFTTKPKIDETFKGYRYGHFEILHGTVTVQTIFHGYHIIDERSGERLDYIELGEGRWYPNLHAFCAYLPNHRESIDGLGALEQLFHIGTAIEIPSERFDTSSWSEIDEEPVVFIYENYKGGIGTARQLFEDWTSAVKSGITFGNSCECKLGCPNCIVPAKSWSSSNTNIDKQAGIILANQLLAAEQIGPDHKFQDGLMVPME